MCENIRNHMLCPKTFATKITKADCLIEEEKTNNNNDDDSVDNSFGHILFCVSLNMAQRLLRKHRCVCLSIVVLLFLFPTAQKISRKISR